MNIVLPRRKFILGAAASGLLLPSSLAKATAFNSWFPTSQYGTDALNVKGYGAKGDNSTDDTAAITAACAAIPSGGGRLYFPAGHYLTTGGFTLSYPTLIYGDGAASLVNYGIGATTIECTSTSAKLFTVNSSSATFSDIALTNFTTAVSGSSAIYVTNASDGQQVDYSRISTWGFYDAIDVGVGQNWVMDSCVIAGYFHWGTRVRDTVQDDAGDWTICNNVFLSNPSVAACLRYESGGGGRIINNKFNGGLGAGRGVSAISMNLTGGSQQVMVTANNMENFSASPIQIDSGWAHMTIVDNYIATIAYPAVTATSCDQMVIANNVCTNGSTPPVAFALSSVTNSTIGPNQLNGYSFDISGGSSSVILQSQMPVLYGVLPAATTVAPGSKAVVTDLTALTFGSAAAGSGSGSNATTGPVYSNGTNWIVG